MWSENILCLIKQKQLFQERGLLISFTTLNKVDDYQNKTKNATLDLCEDCFILFDRSHPYIEKISARWAGGPRTVYQFRAFSTGKSCNNTNKLKTFHSDLFCCLFLYFWACFDRWRIKSSVDRRGKTRCTAGAKSKHWRPVIFWFSR